MSATVAAAVKAAIVILSNEEARKKVGWGIVAILKIIYNSQIISKSCE